MFFKKNKFQAPWDIPLAARINTLLSNPDKKKIVYLYEKPDSSTFRYRVYNMCQALTLSEEWRGTYFFENELESLKEHLKSISVLVFCRTRWSLQFEEFMDRAKKNNIPLLFDIDDLIFNLDKVPLVMNTLSVPFREDQIAHWFSYSSRLWQLGKKCDATIGTNAYIGGQLISVFNKPNFVINNFLNHEQIETSKHLFAQKKSARKPSPFTLGYFSGSASHANDFAKIAPEIAALLNELPEIRLEVAGFMQFPECLKHFVKKKRIVHSSFVDFLRLQEKIANVDLNLVPLVDNEFTHCKSELKFFEAAIVGTTTLATPTYVYQENIQHGKTGYLCEEGDWYPLIKDIYLKTQGRELIEAANAYCLNKYAPQNQLRFIEDMAFKSMSSK